MSLSSLSGERAGGLGIQQSPQHDLGCSVRVDDAKDYSTSTCIPFRHLLALSFHLTSPGTEGSASPPQFRLSSAPFAHDGDETGRRSIQRLPGRLPCVLRGAVALSKTSLCRSRKTGPSSVRVPEKRERALACGREARA